MKNEFQYIPVSEDYYKEEDFGNDAKHLNRMLKWYLDHYDTYGGASVLVPIGAIKAMRNMCQWSNGRALVISGDKGNNNPSHFRGLHDPHFAIHGSFSLMVNYHAVGLFVTSRGGFAMHNPQEDANLKVSGFVLMGGEDKDTPAEEWRKDNVVILDKQRQKNYKALSSAFNEDIEIFGPNDFFVLQKYNHDRPGQK
jgi:hypothetical protein